MGSIEPKYELKKISSVEEQEPKSVMNRAALGEAGHVWRTIVCVAGDVLMWRWWSRAALDPCVSVAAVREQRHLAGVTATK